MHSDPITPIDLRQIRVYPLAERRSLTQVEQVLIPVDAKPQAIHPSLEPILKDCAEKMKAARSSGSSIILMYGAHLLRNGAALILERMMQEGWITHLATNGAGTIHDWEYAWFGQSTESVEQNVATGTFGTWDETGRNIHLALLAGALKNEGYGKSLGRFIMEDGTTLPTCERLEMEIRSKPSHPLTAARADLLQSMMTHNIPGGVLRVIHPWKQASILGQAFRHAVPVTVHPGIGYDIISNHPMFSGSAIGRGAEHDFALFGGSVQRLDGGVVLSVGSAIMAPQVFEKSLSCVNNLRLQHRESIVRDHNIYVVDLQEGGGWDWTTGEPPKTHPAYYLRFCKSFSRMGGRMQYMCCDNLAFIQHLWRKLSTV